MTLPDDHQEKVFSDNLYERLGVSENASVQAIEQNYKEQYRWWQTRPTSNPKFAAKITPAKNNLEQAREVLLNPAQREKYDEKLQKERRQANEAELDIKKAILLQSIATALADGRLSKAEKWTILQSAQELKIPENIAEDLIDEALDESGAIYDPNDELATQSPGGRPKLVIEDLPERHLSFSKMRLNSTDYRVITINNSGGGINSGSITPSEPWLTVSSDELDSTVHRQTIRIMVNTSGLELSHRYSGTVKIQSLGGTEVIKVELKMEGAEKRAMKPTKVSSGITAAMSFGFLGLLSYSTLVYMTLNFYILLVLILIGAGGFRMILNKRGWGYFWLFLSFVSIGFTNIWAMIILTPIPLSRWFSRPIFFKFPTKTSLAAIIPFFLCFSSWSGGYFLMQYEDGFLKNWKASANIENTSKTALPTAIVTAPQGASVRSGPGKSYDRITALPNGAKVSVIEGNGSWIKIQYGQNRQTGFIYKTLLSTN